MVYAFVAPASPHAERPSRMMSSHRAQDSPFHALFFVVPSKAIAKEVSWAQPISPRLVLLRRHSQQQCCCCSLRLLLNFDFPASLVPSSTSSGAATPPPLPISIRDCCDPLLRLAAYSSRPLPIMLQPTIQNDEHVRCYYRSHSPCPVFGPVANRPLIR